jgi:two-component system sensor histidine kinase KdpD
MTATTAAAFVAMPARGEVSGALIFVVGITLAGATMGLGAAILAAIISFLLYNFYFAEPVLTFRFDTVSDLAPLVVFNISAVISGVLAGRLRDEAAAAAAANASLTALLQISQSLQSAIGFEDIEAALTGPAGEAAGLRLLPSVERDAGASGDTGGDRPQARVVEVPMTGSSSHPSTYRIECGTRAIALMVLQAAARDEGTELALGLALANLVALAMERAALSERVAETQAAARTESLKSALLSSVSHDFRTPLTTISASASSLIDYGDRLEPEVAANLLRSIVEESERLNRFTANLLEMTRLEGGQAIAPGQIVSVSDIISAALRRIRSRAGRRVITRAECEDCFVLADPALFELVLINVLENAILYSPDGSRIGIDLLKDAHACTIAVADEGRGIPKKALARVFERFYRVDSAEQMPRGSGLGLAIAHGFVQAFGGSIAAEVPGIGGRGARIRISLPLALHEAA